MKQDSKIAVLAGGGRTGKFVVDKLISLGYSVKLLLRKPENFEIQNERIEIIKGDALDLTAVRSWMEGCHAVISTVGQRQGEPPVARQATSHILTSMKENHIKRYILVAGINIDTPFDKKGEQTMMATEWMKKTFPVIQKDRQTAYSLLGDSNSDWTLVRVPLIEFTGATGQITVNLEDCKGTKITAGDIANFLVDQLTDTRYLHKAPFIANV